jgi:hypothetical protein
VELQDKSLDLRVVGDVGASPANPAVPLLLLSPGRTSSTTRTDHE